MDWEPLPKRKPRKRALSSGEGKAQEEESAADTAVGVEEETNSSNYENINHQPQAVRAAAIIQANIAARAMVNRSQTTLESQDGCAGEFWECKSYVWIHSLLCDITSHSNTLYVHI